jgi:nucleoside-diphosphate-sugar epimerase
MPISLITGGNGFVGSTTIAAALKHGHTVIGAVRSRSSGTSLLEIHPEWDASKVSFVEVPDFTAPGAFDSVFKQHAIDYVLHIAAPLLDNPANTDFVEHFEKPNVAGNTELLRSAKEYGKNVKAIAVTGTINAITTGDPEDLKKRALTDEEWLPLTREDAIKAQNPFISYCVGKKLGEQALWKFVEDEKPHFAVTNFLPPLIFGPPLQKISNMASVNYSVAQVYSIFNGSNDVVPHTHFAALIDVRDLAELHIKALTTPAAANKRFVVGRPMTYQELANVMKTIPEVQGRVAKDNDQIITLPRLETKPVEEALPIKYRTLEETVHDTVKALLTLEKKFSAS